DHAGFSTQAARATTDVLTPYRMVLACELVAAVRALRMAQLRPVGRELADARTLAAGALSPDTRDRPLDDDLAAALDLLPRLAGA
ncbi:MAG: aromatic amino acid ammonia-lyase, partial [Streptosporangiaceae bacterium]